MFDVEIKNLKIFANIGITPDERKKKQLLKVTLNFSYSVAKGKDLEVMNNLKDYSKKETDLFIGFFGYEILCNLLGLKIKNQKTFLNTNFKVPNYTPKMLLDESNLFIDWYL